MGSHPASEDVNMADGFEYEYDDELEYLDE